MNPADAIRGALSGLIGIPPPFGQIVGWLRVAYGSRGAAERLGTSLRNVQRWSTAAGQRRATGGTAAQRAEAGRLWAGAALARRLRQPIRIAIQGELQVSNDRRHRPPIHIEAELPDPLLAQNLAAAYVAREPDLLAETFDRYFSDAYDLDAEDASWHDIERLELA